MSKQTTISLSFRPAIAGGEDSWIVVKVKNSTDYRPGMCLDKNETNTLCAAKNWQVTITA